ncbi:hypothetical protein EJ06DRAFT_583484 [Trichodelitschia bisporula]|uniref:Mediator of RNA polymerase II transcription subunit 13 n=1 Tax=Trichodelitschia bisporula TaxID=703511 RepID=A0A6G1HS39_9PEZI|nr:hypothetical protein EJ06DRAFT_583484 [Trichodelitschia bisporula]
MDFLRSCYTGVQTLSGFTHVAYKIYTLAKRPQGTEDTRASWENLWAVERHLRENKVIGHLDYSRCTLWVFEAGETVSFQTGPLEDATSCALTQVFFGTLKAADLLYCNRPLSTPTPSPGAGPHGTPSNTLRASQMANLRAMQQNAAAQTTQDNSPVADIRTVHAIFCSGITSMVLYHLARYQQAVPLDSRTFVLPSLHPTPKPARLQPVVLDVYLTSNGTLVIASNGAASFCPLSPLILPRREALVVYVAPCGTLALVSDEEVDFDGSESRLWRGLVEAALDQKGIVLPNLDRESSWVRLRSQFPQGDQSFTPQNFLWPAELCFQHSPDPVERLDSDGVDGLGKLQSLPPSSWFYNPDHSGYISPWDFAEKWLLGKPERDRMLEAQRQRQIDMETAQKHAESAAAASSPLNNRNVNYSDIHINSGVYPTPPDGIISQATTVAAHPDIPALSGPFDGNSAMQIDSKGPVDMNLTDFDFGSRGRQDHSMGDDLFGDMDEDDFVGNDITDADFSFFDEPDDVGHPGGADATAGASEPQVVVVKEGPADETEALALVKTDTPFNDNPKPDLHSGGQELEVKQPLNSPPIVLRPILTPISVRQKLFSANSLNDSNARRQSAFEHVSFSSEIDRTDAKYSSNGPFFVPDDAKRKPDEKATSKSLPPSRAKRRKVTQPQGVKLEIAYDSDGDSVTSSASDDDLEYSYDIASPANQLYADKRVTGLREEGTASLATSPGDFMGDATTATHPNQKELVERLAAVLTPENSTQRTGVPQPSCMDRFMALDRLSGTRSRPQERAKPPDSPLNPMNKDFISVAQIIAEQVIFSTLDILQPPRKLFGSGNAQQPIDYTAQYVHATNLAVRQLFQSAVDCDLLKFISIQEATEQPSKQQQQTRQIPRRTNSSGGPVDSTSFPLNHVTVLQPPHVRLRRGDACWDILPTALPFWEYLGLAPTSGPKNITAYAIYPGNDDLKGQVKYFIDALANTYETCKLGSFALGDGIGGYDDALFPVHIGENYSMTAASKALHQLCNHVGRALASAEAKRRSDDSKAIDNFVVFMINPFNTRNGIAELCSAFWTLYQGYRQPPRSPTLKSTRPDLVLQIIPIAYVAAPFTMVLPEVGTMQRLAREVYDRCPPAVPAADPSRLRIYSAPSIQLEESLPKSIQFKLIPDPPSDLLYENSKLHLGYARSCDKAWLTAAWTDSSGKYQATASYNLSNRPFFDLAKELWASTLDILSERRITWRLAITRVGTMERDELDAWITLASAPAPLTIVTAITTIDPNPQTSIFHRADPTPPPAPTPVATPGAASGISASSAPDAPHALTPAATPSASADGASDPSSDPDAHLVDPSDETWGVVLGHRPPPPSTSLDTRPLLASGFLLHPPPAPGAPISPMDCDSEGGNSGRGMDVMGVHLVWVGRAGGVEAGVVPKGTAEGMLKEYLVLWRGLALLARVRGLRGGGARGLPWHVLVALRGVEGLEGVLGEG